MPHRSRPDPAPLIAAALLVALCAGCASRYAQWDGRRGYDGRGDYGYDLAASQSAARGYRARAARAYPAPGTPDDPWGPYISEAAGRFGIPQAWVRAVMAQESGGHLYDADGGLITSPAGAMGLMQVMPATYQALQARYGLGGDPYEPRDNILAGAAYLREMYDRYGAPNFLAAYNAGPDRLDAYLAGGGGLPDETVNYVASIAPVLGMAGTLAGAPPPGAADRAYAGGGMTGEEYAAAAAAPAPVSAAPVAAPVVAAAPATVTVADDPSLRAYDGGGLVTPGAPTGAFAAAAPRPIPVSLPVSGATEADDWAIQVGAFPDPARSQAVLAAARARGGALLAASSGAIIPVRRGALLYRARLTGLSADGAASACALLQQDGMDCFAVPPGS